MKTQVIISAQRIQAFSQDQIISMLPVDVLRDVKAKDEHPFFQMYVIAHEGESNPRMIGEGHKNISWPRRAIQSMKNVIMKGIKLFAGHNADSSTTGRRELGEVVHNTEKEIDGKLSHVVITYHPQSVKSEVEKYDVCSQEAEWDLIEDAGRLIADKIYQITGIALGKSSETPPAFAGAKRLAMVQAFADTKTTEPLKKEKQMTFYELKEEIRKLGVFPSQIFDLDDLKKDNKFMQVVEKYEKFSDIEVQLAEAKKTLQEKETEMQTLEKKNLASTAKDRLTRMSQEKGLTDNQKKYLESQVDNISDFTDEGLNQFVERGLETFKSVASLLNVSEPQITQQTDQSTGDDPYSAKSNPLLEEDFTEE